VLHEQQQVELQRERGVVRDLVGCALRDEHPRHEQAEAQVCGFGLRAVVVPAGAVRGRVSDKGFRVQVDALDVEARGVRGGEGEIVEGTGAVAAMVWIVGSWKGYSLGTERPIGKGVLRQLLSPHLDGKWRLAE
jgi:hypothetical protein